MGTERRRQNDDPALPARAGALLRRVRIGAADPPGGRAARQRVGYVPQDLPIAPMTVGRADHVRGPAEAGAAGDGAARLVQLGIAEHGDKPVSALSGGMKQRLALALALIGIPRCSCSTSRPPTSTRAVAPTCCNCYKRSAAGGDDPRLFLAPAGGHPGAGRSRADLVKRSAPGASVTRPRSYASSVRPPAWSLFLRNGHVKEALTALAD